MCLNPPDFVVGLDISLTSPGITVVDMVRNTVHFACFAQRKREAQMVGKSILLTPNDKYSFTLHVLPNIPTSSVSDYIRFKHIVDELVGFVHRMTSSSAVIKFIIEDYAYSAGGANSFKLMELGGIVKYVINKRFPVKNVYRISVSSWKKYFTGKGNATKRQVCDSAISLHRLPDLFPVFGFKNENQENIPCPIQDIYDSVAITGIFLAPPPAINRRKKKNNQNEIVSGEPQSKRHHIYSGRGEKHMHVSSLEISTSESKATELSPS